MFWPFQATVSTEPGGVNEKKQFIGSPYGDPMRSVCMLAVFLPCQWIPEWILHSGLLLQQPPAACTHLMPDLARKGCSKHARCMYAQTTAPFLVVCWHSIENDSNQDILIQKMQRVYIHHLSRGPCAQSCCTRAETRRRPGDVVISAARWS